MEKIKVLIVDDHVVVREGFQTLIETRSKDIAVVGTAANAQETMAIVAQVQPDLILMDLRLPVVNGVEITKEIRRQYPSIKILILTSIDEKSFIIEGLKAGASGYLLKDVSWVELESAIYTVYNGGILLSQGIADVLIDRSPEADYPKGAQEQTYEEERLSEAILSTKEKDILRMVAQGLDNKTIAKKIFLSEGTVRNYISRIYELIGAHDRAQAVIWAVHHGLVEINDKNN